MEKHYKIIIEKHSDGYVSYPLGLKGVVCKNKTTGQKARIDVGVPASGGGRATAMEGERLGELVV